jgi:hypothetical protein
MNGHGSGDVRFSEALALWLPAAFSSALMAFALVDLFTSPHLPIPWYQAMMLIAVLGATVHGALLQQRRRIKLLEQSLAALAPKHTAV